MPSRRSSIDDRRRARLWRHNTTGSYFPGEFSFVPRSPEKFDDEVFKEESQEDLEVENSNITSFYNLNNSSLTIKTISEHFRNLFKQCENFASMANQTDAADVRKRVTEMREIMEKVNCMFDDIMNKGEHLEKYLESCQNGKN
jgi:hypothetical protein